MRILSTVCKGLVAACVVAASLGVASDVGSAARSDAVTLIGAASQGGVASRPGAAIPSSAAVSSQVATSLGTAAPFDWTTRIGAAVANSAATPVRTAASDGTASNPARNCWTDAGAQYGVDPLLLYSIAEVESSMNPRALNRNRDGSIDIGLMQINSTHLACLSMQGITRERLLREPCTAIQAGAQILAGFIDRYGYTWDAVGAYNAGGAPSAKPLRRLYAAKVSKAYRRLTLLRAQRAQHAQQVQQGVQVAATGG